MGPRTYVRLALPSEAQAIAELQRDGWSDPAHPGHSMAEALEVEQVAQVWHRSITRPPLASYRVLVCVVPAGRQAAGPVERTVGFVAVSPSDDPDAQADVGSIVELVVAGEPDSGSHRALLVQAAVDTMRADGFTTARWWVPATDDALRAELDEAGWAPDGVHQELRHPDDDSVRVKLVRLHTDISG